MPEGAFAAVLCGLLSAVLLGLADFWSAKTVHRAGPAAAVVVVNIIGFLGFAAFYATWQPRLMLDASGSWFAVGGGLAMAAGQVTFYKALHIGPVSLVSPLSSAYPFVTTVGVIAFFHSQISLQRLCGFIIVMLGVLAASGSVTYKRSEKRWSAGPTWALLTALLWGTGYLALTRALHSMDWQTVSLVQLFVMSVTCPVIALSVTAGERIFNEAMLKLFFNRFALGAGLVQTLGLIAINVGMQGEPDLAPVVTAVSACYPVLAIFLSIVYFREKVKSFSLGGAVLIIAGIVVLSIG